MKLSDAVKNLDGKLIADAEFKTLEYCTSEIELDFLTFVENEKYLNRISPFAKCAILKQEMVNQIPDTIKGIFISQYPKEAFHSIHNELKENVDYCLPDIDNRICGSSRISSTAVIAEKNVIIGKNTVVEDNVVIKEHSIIGDHCIIHQGAIIGGKAFTFCRGSNQSIVGLMDMGKVILGNRVEVFPMAHIARGILPTDATCLDDDVKIDAFVHIGHGAHIKERTMIAAGAIIGGNARIGHDSWVGINATVSNRISVGNYSRVSLGSVVTKNVPDGQTVTGNFAIEHSQFINNIKEISGEKCKYIQ